MMAVRPLVTFDEHAPSFMHLLLDTRYHQTFRLFLSCRIMHQRGFDDVPSESLLARRPQLKTISSRRVPSPLVKVDLGQAWAEGRFYRISSSTQHRVCASSMFQSGYQRAGQSYPLNTFSNQLESPDYVCISTALCIALTKVVLIC